MTARVAWLWLLAAPVAAQDAGMADGGLNPAIVLHRGDPAPSDGVFMDDPKFIDTSKRLTSAEAIAVYVSDKTVISIPATVTAASAAVSAIAGALSGGYVLGQDSRPKP